MIRLINEEDLAEAKLIITSITGEVIWEQIMNTCTQEIDLSSDSAGLYFI
jgi:hypothetical protein